MVDLFGNGMGNFEGKKELKVNLLRLTGSLSGKFNVFVITFGKNLHGQSRVDFLSLDWSLARAHFF